MKRPAKWPIYSPQQIRVQTQTLLSELDAISELRTAVRSNSEMIFTLPPRATRVLVRRRSSYSREMVTPMSSFARLLILTLIVSAGLSRLARAQTGDVLAKIAVKVVHPEYPYEARRSHIEGHGVLVAEVDYNTGKVTSVKMEKSTGSRILDQAALSAFIQWQFKPKTVRQFRTPINYEMARSRAEAMDKMRRIQATSQQGSR